MRVLLVNKYYYQRSGTERCLFNTKRLLEAKGHRVEVFAMAHPRNEPATYAREFVPHLEFHDLRPRGYPAAAHGWYWRRRPWSPGARGEATVRSSASSSTMPTAPPVRA